MTADAADGDIRATGGGSGADTRDTRAEETAWAARRGDEGVLIRVFFCRGRPEGVGVAVGVAAVAGDRRRFRWSVDKVTTVLSPRNGVDGTRARTLP